MTSPPSPFLVQPAPRRDGWRIFGIVLAVLVAIAGLVLMAGIVLLVVVMNSFGSNK